MIEQCEATVTSKNNFNDPIVTRTKYRCASCDFFMWYEVKKCPSCGSTIFKKTNGSESIPVNKFHRKKSW